MTARSGYSLLATRYYLAPLAFIFLFTSGCGPKSQNSKQSFQKPPIPVEVVQVQRHSISQTVSVSGNIKSESEVTVVSKVQARILWIEVKEGDTVRRGQALIRLESNDIAAQMKQAQAQVLQAKARFQMAISGARPQEKKQSEENVKAAKVAYETAKKDYERMQVLHGHGSISDQQFDQTRSRYEDAKAGYENAKQQLQMVYEGPREEEKEAARATLLSAAATLQYYRTQMSYTRIVSPCNCSVAERLVDPGEMASPGIPLLTLIDNSKLFFEAEFSEKQAAVFRKDLTVSVKADGVPDETFNGRLMNIYPSVDPASRSMKGKISIQNQGKMIRSGMFARGEVTVAKKENALVVDRDAVRFSEQQPFVFVLKHDSDKVSRLNVTLGLTDEGRVEVKSGLSEGDQVVLTGSLDLKEGSVVKVIR